MSFLQKKKEIRLKTNNVVNKTIIVLNNKLKVWSLKKESITAIKKHLL
jgi:hypothetical protein